MSLKKAQDWYMETRINQMNTIIPYSFVYVIIWNLEHQTNHIEFG